MCLCSQIIIILTYCYFVSNLSLIFIKLLLYITYFRDRFSMLSLAILVLTAGIKGMHHYCPAMSYMTRFELIGKKLQPSLLHDFNNLIKFVSSLSHQMCVMSYERRDWKQQITH